MAIPTFFKKIFLCIALCASFVTYGQNALDFDGVDDYVLTSFPGISGNCTIEAWIKTSATPVATGTILGWVSTNSGGTQYPFPFQIYVDSNNLINVSYIGPLLVSITTVNDGMWHHVAVVFDGNTLEMELFIDGILEDMLPNVLMVNSGTQVNMKLGSYGNSSWYEGKIDEVRIWNVNKSVGQILAGMNDEVCLAPSELIAYYKFDEGVADGLNTGITVLPDHSGNGYHGTLANMALTGTSSNWGDGVTLGMGSTYSVYNETTCLSYTWAVNGTSYTTAGTYNEVIAGGSYLGCDSTAVLNLSIVPLIDSTSNIMSCGSYTWPVNGTTYTTSTSVTELLTNGQGCDYSHTLNLTVGASNTGSESVSNCDSYFWPANGSTYTSSGTFTETLTNVSGCDSIATLNLTINTVDNSAQDNGDGTLSANLSGASYQWIDCSNNIISFNETNQFFSPTVNGSYAVVVTDNNCSDTSVCMTVSNVGIKENSFNNFSLFPNPTSGKVTINLGKIHESISVSIYTIAGRFVSEITEYETSEMSIDLYGSLGVYLMEIQTESGETATFRIAKK